MMGHHFVRCVVAGDLTMMRSAVRLLAIAAAVGTVHATAPLCDVLEYGAVGDNATEDTAAVAAALADCGGRFGTVVLPAEHVFLLRPIRIPSRVTLRIDGDIAAWRDIASWPNATVSKKLCNTSPYQSINNTEAVQLESLLWAINATQITIDGSGTIHGQGWRWWPLRSLSNYWHHCRPSLLEFGRRGPEYSWGVSDVKVSGITLLDSPFWTVSVRNATRVTFSGVHVTTGACGYAHAPNTDGFNIQGEDLLIEDCTVRNGDD